MAPGCSMTLTNQMLSSTQHEETVAECKPAYSENNTNLLESSNCDLVSCYDEIYLDQIPLPSTPPPATMTASSSSSTNLSSTLTKAKCSPLILKISKNSSCFKSLDTVDSFEILEQTIMKQKRLGRLKNNDLRMKILLKRTFNLVCEIMDRENGFEEEEEARNQQSNAQQQTESQLHNESSSYEDSSSDEEEEDEPSTPKSITLTEESIDEQFYSTETLIINLNESETLDSCFQASGEQEAFGFIHDLENINFSRFNYESAQLKELETNLIDKNKSFLNTDFFSETTLTELRSIDDHCDSFQLTKFKSSETEADLMNSNKRCKKRRSSAHDDDSDDEEYPFDNDNHVQQLQNVYMFQDLTNSNNNNNKKRMSGAMDEPSHKRFKETSS